ncbi:hypothetical protein NM688_g7093 [Phlebia brevispora]|uniref:Uncharacterized protein n=1 Tax=Phlebia brevispora TaxID=194682 RepID=A0ACC1S986_9APHY|nr:hypothetical protein NM688_g7093 [Phlebia brevispora]
MLNFARAQQVSPTDRLLITSLIRRRHANANLYPIADLPQGAAWDVESGVLAFRAQPVTLRLLGRYIGNNSTWPSGPNRDIALVCIRPLRTVDYAAVQHVLNINNDENITNMSMYAAPHHAAHVRILMDYQPHDHYQIFERTNADGDQIVLLPSQLRENDILSLELIVARRVTGSQAESALLGLRMTRIVRARFQPIEEGRADDTGGN